jgi:putative hydrolase of the HAD superfamily
LFCGNVVGSVRLRAMEKKKIIAFDADDTLWENEPYFREAEKKVCGLLEDFLTLRQVEQELFKTEIQNIPLYGYGVKGFLLSMIETALRVSNGKITSVEIARILEVGKELLEKPVVLLEGVKEVVADLSTRYRLVVATKGDLLDQERKLEKSGISHYFHHVEVMSEKNEKEYGKLLRHLDCEPERFWMIGNSLKSDVLPVLNLGGNAVHVPFHTTWAHEMIHHKIEHPRFHTCDSLKQVGALF